MASLIRLSIVCFFVGVILIAAVLVGWADIGDRGDDKTLFIFLGLVGTMGLSLHGVLLASDRHKHSGER